MVEGWMRNLARVGALTGTLCSASFAAPSAYDAKDVYAETAPGQYVLVHGLNASGQVVGERSGYNTPGTIGFATGPQGDGVNDPCPAGMLVCSAQGIDDAGRVALRLGEGNIFVGVQRERSAVGNVDGTVVQHMGDLGGNDGTQVWGMSANGLLTGYSRNGRNGVHGFGSRVPGRQLLGLHELEGVRYCEGLAVNTLGQVVGYCQNFDLSSRAFVELPDGSRAQDLGSLGGLDNAATAISANGYIVGYASVSDGRQTATLALLGTPGLLEIGNLGGPYSQAEGVNSAGTVVGSSMAVDGQYHAFVYDVEDAVTRDLSSMTVLPAGVWLTDASAINEGRPDRSGGERSARLLVDARTLTPGCRKSGTASGATPKQLACRLDCHHDIAAASTVITNDTNEKTGTRPVS